ncbi:DUF4238 domain-containing protein [Polaromonas sp. LjRoot131]|uniref:DUF4238 domain-containing protein n=1 Tax=Polaromonas sp. LjRoot131 TaxID=3342262 RepID=UPI003ECD6271
MAGRKQHYLPQHLLRGFEASRTGKKSQVVVNKKGTTAYKTSTEGVAAQRDFYSQPGDGVTDTLDDIITDFESTIFNPFLDRVRTAPPNEPVDSEDAASAVVHLTIRAAHLRGSFAHLARKMVTRFDEILKNPEHVRELFGVDSTSPKSLLAEEIQRTFDELPSAALTAKERGILEKMAHFRAREKLGAQMPKSATVMREYLSMLEEAVPNMVVQGHTKALEQSLVPTARLDSLKKLHWKVFAVESPDHFVLPDCVAVACAPSGQLQPVAMSPNEEISWIAMPVSATQVLVGYGGQEPPILSNLNEHFAKCSIEFFVSSILRPDIETLTTHIGEALELATRDLMEESFAAVRPVIEKPVVEISASDIRNVPVVVRSGANAMRDISDSIRQIFTLQCGAREADRLESIVVTNDVPGEVARLFGRDLWPYEAAVTMPGTVELIPGTTPLTLRLLLPESTGHLLLAEDESLRQSATLVVRRLLGRVSYLDHWFSYLAPLADGRVFTARQHIALNLMRRFTSLYYGSVEVALVATENDLHNGEPLSGHAVTTALAALETARHQFQSHKNVDALVVDLIPAIDMLLGTLAGYCGQHPHDSENRPILQTSLTCEPLVHAGLWDWALLFRRDLNRHHQSLTRKSSSVDQMLALSEHMERVLWQIGIFLSDIEEGKMWVDVCDDERLKMVKQALNS